MGQFGRWFSSEQSSIFACTAVKMIDSIKNKVPPCVITLIAARSNGWDTGRRIQVRDSQCCIHSGFLGEDSVEHYAYCTEPWIALCSKTGLSLKKNLENLIVVGTDKSQSWVFLACHLYAVKRAADQGRACSPCSSSMEVRNLIFGGYKVAAFHSSGLASRYASVWK